MTPTLQELTSSPPAETAPRWMPAAFAFVAGVALTAAVLNPSIATPDYQRGHRAGYDAGFQDGVSLRRVDHYAATPEASATPWSRTAPAGARL